MRSCITGLTGALSGLVHTGVTYWMPFYHDNMLCHCDFPAAGFLPAAHSQTLCTTN